MHSPKAPTAEEPLLITEKGRSGSDLLKAGPRNRALVPYQDKKIRAKPQECILFPSKIPAVKLVTRGVTGLVGVQT